MESGTEELFVSSFISPEYRTRVRGWLRDPKARKGKVLEKLYHRFEEVLDPRWTVSDSAEARARFEHGVSRLEGRRCYLISADQDLDGRRLSEEQARKEAGGFYESLIAIVDPERCATYRAEDGKYQVFLFR